jgi:ribonuclease G
MSKELIISITSQETKAAILENDQVVEINIERDKEHGIVGSIYRGKVTKVLPGMQSAFVDIGLERDAFLYVSDFFEDTEEYDKLVSTAEEQVAKLEQGPKDAPHTSSEGFPGSSEGALNAPNILKYHDRRNRPRRSRRSRLRGKRYEEAPSFPTETHPINHEPVKGQRTDEFPQPSQMQEFPSILPGESLAKYQNLVTNPIVHSVDTEERFVSDNIVPSQVENLEDGVEEAEHSEAFGKSEEPKENEQTGKGLLAPLSSEAQDLFIDKVLEDTQTSEVASELSSRGSELLAEAPEATGKTEEPEASPSAEIGPVTMKEESPVERTSVDTFSEEKAPEEVLGSQSEVTKSEAASAFPLPSEILGIPQQAPPAATSIEKMTAIPTSSSPTSKVQFRNPPNTARFFRRDMDQRRRQHGFNEDRKDAHSSAAFPLIGDLLKEGQEILVQISKEPLGTKGARITSHIALPGRYLVYMPTVEHIGVSRKIESEEERQRLKRIIQENRGNLPGGFIVRTAGQSKGEEEFKSDIKFLSALWAEIKSKSDKKAAPALIHRDLNLVQRLLRDQLSSDFSAIRVDNEIEYAGIVEFINRFQPALVNRVKLYTKDTPIFEEFGIQAEIDRALRSKVWLKSGGYIVIDQVEALIAIDVNTGKYVGKSNKLEDTIVKTNIEAAKEIARQIRLRDLGGIIVCDFIDMEDRKNRLKVTQTLEEALRSDRSPSKILQFNDFGLVAITRKRVKQSLLKVLCEPCTHCAGSGMVKSPQTVCYEIQGEVKKMAKFLDNKEITLRVNPEVAKALKTSEASVVNEIESSLRKEVILKSDSMLHQEHFDIF